MTNKLIFDLGFHNGTDTRYYLKKGYNVIAVEANPALCKQGEKEFKKKIKSGDLVLLNKVFSDKSGTFIDFYIHKNTDWSTADRQKAKYLGILKNKVSVSSISYRDLLTYGLPEYIKCDIEGLDYLLIKQISELSHKKPEYLSFELSRLDYFKIFSYLYISGYSKFQLRNQAHNPEFSSGDFGKYLPSNKWLDFDTVLTQYMKYKELKAIDNVNLALGWVDIHAKL
jgi:FkbM family methyltransferase